MAAFHFFQIAPESRLLGHVKRGTLRIVIVSRQISIGSGPAEMNERTRSGRAGLVGTTRRSIIMLHRATTDLTRFADHRARVVSLVLASSFSRASRKLGAISNLCSLKHGIHECLLTPSEARSRNLDSRI